MEGTSAFGALSKMGEGPPKSVCRRRLQTATSCGGDSAPVVSVAGKGAARPRQVRSVELNVSEPLMTCRDDLHGVETGGECGPREKVGLPYPGPALCPTGTRHGDGKNADQASTRNRRTRRPDAKGAAQAAETASA